MKIDLLITELEPGGAERCCVALAKFLQERQHTVRVISLGKRPGPGREGLVRQLEDKKISIHFLDASPRTPPWIVQDRLLALLRTSRPDLAQGFLWHANWMGASVYSKNSVPFFAGVRVTEPRRWRAWISRFWIRKSCKIVCVSQDVAQWCHRVEGAPWEKLVVIPNGIKPVDVTEAVPDPRRSSSDRILLFVGRLAEQKGIDGMLRYVPQMLKALPDHHLVVLGDGPLEKTVRRACDALPASDRDRVSVLGRVENIDAWMRYSEILLHPARYEGMPNAVLEAMSHGMAIAAFDVEGVRELLGDRAAEQVAPKEDWGAWLALAVRLGRENDLRADLGSANRKRSDSAFRLSDQLAKYLDVWNESIERNR